MKKLKPRVNEDKTIIAGERYEGEDKPEYRCSFCNITLVRLRDSSQQDVTYWCKHCSVEFDPEAENLRKQSKLIVPDRNEEPAITSVGVTPDVSIRHEPELRGGFSALAKKGTIRFTSYQES
jgi:DNA-directed RNA polymerase subunit RPC12/RpoP